MKQATPGTFGSSKLLTQTLSFGDTKLNVALIQPISSAHAFPKAAEMSTAASNNDFMTELPLTVCFGQGYSVHG
jgi:hypothetical protein